jgi:hypothetical protein
MWAMLPGGMRDGVGMVMALCGSGNDTLAAFVILGAAAIYVLVVVTVIRRAESPDEVPTLVGVLTLSIAIGVPLAFLSVFWQRSDAPWLVILLLVASLIGGVAVAGWRRTSLARTVFLAWAGLTLLPVGYFFIFLVTIAIGTGCIDD